MPTTIVELDTEFAVLIAIVGDAKKIHFGIAEEFIGRITGGGSELVGHNNNSIPQIGRNKKEDG